MMFLSATIIASLLFGLASGYTVHLKPAFTNGTVLVEQVSVPGNLDGAKAKTSVNRTTSDFWYFDTQAARPGNDAAVEVVFFNFPDLRTPHPLAFQVTGAFPNGTRFHKTAAADGGVTVTNDAKGIRGEWKGVDASFVGSPLDQPNVTYRITINSTQTNVYGTVTLKSRAPAHYPCDLNVPGVSEALAPNLYWSNAVPDAIADVDVTIDGTRVKFTDGIGYHDKNFADASIVQSSHKFWDWGHASFGPYSAVWFAVTEKDNRTYPYAYVAKNGKPIHVGCGHGSVQIRQWGGEAAYPPRPGSTMLAES
ncbi:uncharacterized protein P174DRAFT_480671 [Aspergillus novofumigatus IBT 16806]|uniref:Uncharacterized protein n=1 Tax=Aspergillus novofumigatus (strain IBT 16806) TaxID=1392255 RepID=A0A2I1CC09_ASPN1|nr:uncharacterized protein P174DRAFT_480671 [Aspergillus novofumigatus IBT 16806]PKX95162.1 hypothetical protein P174DRAFT_480671 [Aspergillus novofumigatus IBT 16806]